MFPIASAPLLMVDSVMEASSESSPATLWPADMNYYYPLGSNKLKLNLQSPLIRQTMCDVIMNIKASLLFENAFPDAGVSQTLASETLMCAAGSRPERAALLWRFQDDAEYFAKLVPIVCSPSTLSLTHTAIHQQGRTRICHVWSKVKDHCCTIVGTVFRALEDPPLIAKIAQRQVARYTYIYPFITDVGD